MVRFFIALLLAAPTLHAAGPDADRLLVESLLAVSQSRMPEALTAVNQLTLQHPNFRLAQLIKGDLLLARRQPLLTLGNTGNTPNAALEQLRSASFRTESQDLQSFGASKQQVNAAKSWIKVGRAQQSQPDALS